MSTQDDLRKIADKLDGFATRLSQASTMLPDTEKFEDLIKDPTASNLAEVQLATELAEVMFGGMETADRSFTVAKGLRVMADDLDKKGP